MNSLVGNNSFRAQEIPMKKHDAICYGLRSPSFVVQRETVKKVADLLPMTLIEGNVFIAALYAGAWDEFFNKAVTDAVEYLTVAIEPNDLFWTQNVKLVTLISYHFQALNQALMNGRMLQKEQKQQKEAAAAREYNKNLQAAVRKFEEQVYNVQQRQRDLRTELDKAEQRLQESEERISEAEEENQQMKTKIAELETEISILCEEDCTEDDPSVSELVGECKDMLTACKKRLESEKRWVDAATQEERGDIVEPAGWFSGTGWVMAQMDSVQSDLDEVQFQLEQFYAWRD